MLRAWLWRYLPHRHRYEQMVGGRTPVGDEILGYQCARCWEWELEHGAQVEDK